MSGEVEWWTWAAPISASKDNLDLMIKVREAIEGYPPYKARFRLTDILDEGRSASPNSADMMLYFGAWPVPERYTHHRNNHYVNPNYKDRRMYGDCAVQCECGAWVTYNHPKEEEHPWIMEHTDECKLEWREDTRERLDEKRVEIIEESYVDAFLTTEAVAARLGYVEEDSVSTWLSRHDLPTVTSFRRKGRVNMTKTWVELKERGCSDTKIAKAFGVKTQAIRLYIHRYYDD